MLKIEIDDIITSVTIPKLILDKFIKNGTFYTLPSSSDVEMYTGGFTLVFPVKVNNEKWAFRCWYVDLGNLRSHYQTLSQVITKLNLPYFCDFAYVDEGIVVDGKKYPTTRMRWIEGNNLKKYICANKNNTEKLKNLSIKFFNMITKLHEHHISHGDLQHGNILIDSNDELFLIDYDSVYVPELDGECDIIKGLKGYQHPKRGENKKANEKVDYFSELIIYLSIVAIAEKPEFVEKYQVEDSEQLLFTNDDFLDIEHSQIYQDLMALGGKFPVLLKILVDYLKEDDINELIFFPCLIEQYLKKPKILDFRSEYNDFIVGFSYTLFWNVENATCIYLNDKKLYPNAQKTEVTPSQTGEIKYELIADNGFYSVSKTLCLNVCDGVVIDLKVEQNKLRAGKHEKTLLSWSVRNARHAYLQIESDFKQVSMQDARLIMPTETTIYTIKALALDGIMEVFKSISVEVCPESEVVFKSDKKFTFKDVPVTLLWETKNAKEVKLDGISVSDTGSKVVKTDCEKTYVLCVTDEFETKEVSLTVNMLPLPLIKTVLLPMPKLEVKINIQQRLPAPVVQLNTNIQKPNVKLRGLDLGIIKLVGLKPLMPLSIKLGSSLRSRLSTAIDIITNNVKHLKFVSDEKNKR